MPDRRSATYGTCQREAADGGYFAPLASRRYVLLTTFRRDGRPVSAAVQGVLDGDRAYVRAWSRSGTVRRLRHTRGVQVTPCTALGLLSYGPPIDAAARPLSGEEAGRAAGELARKYPVRHPFLSWLLRPGWRGQVVHYELLA